jgi:chemotaxis protein CheC
MKSVPLPDTPLKEAEAWADFREVGNIGAGKAAARLADVIHRRCVISLPDVFAVDTGALQVKLGAQDSVIAALSLKISGDLPATIMVYLKRSHAHTIVRYATNSALEGSGKDFSFTAQFALRQVADSLAESFTKGVNDLLGVKTKRGAGKFILDADAALIKEILSQMPMAGDRPVAISCDFYDVEKSFEGKFIYFLDAASQSIARRQIGRLMNG